MILDREERERERNTNMRKKHRLVPSRSQPDGIEPET